MAKKIDNREMTFPQRLVRMANEDVFSDDLPSLMYALNHRCDELLFTPEQRLQRATRSLAVKKNKRLN